MAITYVGTASVGVSTGAISLSYTPIAGNTLILFVNSTAVGSSAISDSAGNTWHTALASQAPVSTAFIGLYYADNVAGGATTVTIPDVGTFQKAILVEYSGLNSSGSFDSISIPAGTGSSSTQTTNSVSPNAYGELAIAIIGDSGFSVTYSGWTNGFTERTEGQAGKPPYMAFADQVLVGTGSISTTVNPSTATSCSSAVATFKPSTPVTWANPKGFNFRATAAYVTDGVNETSALKADAYPTTIMLNGDPLTFGWVDADANFVQENYTTASPYAPELSGVSLIGTTNARTFYTFQVDLPGPGTYSIGLAAGDPTNARRPFISVTDNGTPFISIPETAVAAGNFLDASDTLLTGAQWQTSNTKVQHTFTSNKLTLLINRPTSSYSPIAHLDVQSVAGGTQTYSFTMSGGADFTGSGAASRIVAEGSRSGGLAFSGTANSAKGLTYQIPTGGITLGGSAIKAKVASYVPSSGVVLGGSASVAFNGTTSYSYTGQGGAIFGGSLTPTIKRNFIGVSGLTFSGDAGYSYNQQGLGTPSVFGFERFFNLLKRNR